ncbi:hypothetical protein Pan44_08090 [Caulifigura coniformis]|uniref:Uncharacterized protein n=1 Tax=Caulifigura coniformis TaxID=2527983 RepID=A0A517S9I8_9PLAN|nr:hypothetical protein [Caulifigura coniformis]QDT52797.1 hypothetical protein Pan44_08090 [Caulifigura coniformis]
MSLDIRYADRPIRTPIDNAVFWLVFLFGGSKAELARYYARFPNACIVLVDNDCELTEFRQRNPSLTYHAIAMGSGTTTRMLHRASAEPVRQASQQTGSSNNGKGFGGRAANAHAAALETIARPDIAEFLRSLPNEAIVRTQGLLKSIRIDVLGSTGGAGFHGGHRPILAAAVQQLETCGRVISVHTNALESLTYVQIAKRARPNGAASLLSMVNDLIDGVGDDQNLLVTKHLLLHELTPFLDDAERRTKFTLLDAAMMNCRQIDQYFSVIEPNDLNDGPLGGVVSREVDFMEGIDQDALAPQVAFNLLPTFRAAFADIQPNPALLDSLRWDNLSVPLNQEPIDSLIGRNEELTTDELIAAICKPSSRHRFRLFALGAHGGEFELAYLRDEFSRTPDRLDEFVDRLRLLETFRAHLESEADWVGENLVVLTTEASALQQSIRTNHSFIQQGKRWRRSGRRLALQEDIRDLRDLSDRLHVRTAEAGALGLALEATRRELTHHRSIISNVDQVLDRFIPRGSLVKVPQYFACELLENAFPHLLRLPGLPVHEQLDRLCGLAGVIDAEGLAHIVHSKSDRLDVLARTIVNGAYDVVGPPHGAQPTQCASRPIFALPPMAPRTEKDLKAEILKVLPGAKVVFMDTLAFGATVMQIRLRRFSKVGELFVGLPGHDLKVAKDDPLSPLNSVDGFLGLDRLGARVVGNRIVFPDVLPADGEAADLQANGHQ